MKNAFKAARDLFRLTGASLVLFLIVFGLIRDLVFLPVLGKLWDLVLMTTPDGYLTAGNLLSTLGKSPWVLLAAIVLLAAVVVIYIWQLSACILGAGYAMQGKHPALKDLLKVSFIQTREEFKRTNWVFPVYVLILLPLANVYVSNDLIGSFSMPEYIGEYIELRPVLLAAVTALFLGIAYLMFRWFYLLPSFVLGTGDFRTARLESLKMTEKGWLKNGIRIALYNLVEALRLGLLPLVLIMLPVFLCYVGTAKLEFASQIFNIIGRVIGLEVVSSITGTFVSISVMCYLVANYRKRKEEMGEDPNFDLPELPQRESMFRSVTKMLVVLSIGLSVLISGTYLAVVYGAKENRGIIAEIFGSTEIIAHKGYSSKAPENTMPAFELADQSNSVDMIELDVWSTKDGIPVVIHNDTITEATGIKKYIYDCTYEELQNYPAVYNMDPVLFMDTRIPSLEEVLATYCASTPILIEIKGYPQDPELPAKIVDLVHRYDLKKECRIHSGEYDALRKVKEIDPDIPCGMILIAAIGGIYNMPYADFFSIEHSLITQGVINGLHRHGKELYAWTVNYPENADRLKFSGVDALITDYPDDIDLYVADTNDLLQDAWLKEIESLLVNLFDDGSEQQPKSIRDADV